jgi:hypothetical protein
MGILVLFALTTGLVSAQTVTVTAPAAGATWVKGTTYAINWTKSGIMPDLVRISLRDPNTLAELGLIQDNVSNTGTFQWAIPASIADGQYRVRVKVKDVAIQDDSDIFSIAAVAPAGTITVQDPGPQYNTVWREGQAHTVKWWVTGSLSGNYSISLMDSTGTNVVQTIIASIPCSPPSCSMGTNQPEPFIPGSYRIRVRNIATNIFGDSQVFTLSPDSIIITLPDIHTYLEKTKTYNITWIKKGTLPSTVKIELIGTYHKVLDLAAPNTGLYSWTVPSWMPIGQYHVAIITTAPDIYFTSQYFTIGYIKVPQSIIKVKIKK